MNPDKTVLCYLRSSAFIGGQGSFWGTGRFPQRRRWERHFGLEKGGVQRFVAAAGASRTGTPPPRPGHPLGRERFSQFPRLGAWVERLALRLLFFSFQC